MKDLKVLMVVLAFVIYIALFAMLIIGKTTLDGVISNMVIWTSVNGVAYGIMRITTED